MFLGGCVGFVFFGGFLLLFLLYFLAVRSRNCLEKFSSCQVWFFSGVVLSSLGFFVDAVFVFVCFSFERQSSGSNRTPPHTHLFFWFFSFVCSARFGRASRFLAFFRGAILGPGRFWDSP